MVLYVLQSPVFANSSTGTNITYSLQIPMRAVSVRISVQFPFASGPACIDIQHTGCPAEGFFLSRLNFIH